MTEFLKKYNLWADDFAGFAFDLQLFSAEDEGRTEEPSEKKLREARDKGQVAKTQELPQAIVVIFGVMVIFIFSSWMYDSCAILMKHYLGGFSRFSITELSIRTELYNMLVETTKLLVPVFVAVVVAAIIGNVAQVGFQFTAHPLKVDFSKIKFDPATMMKKMFFSRQVAMNLIKSLVKVAVIAFVAYLIIANDFEDIMRTPDLGVAAAFKIMMLSSMKIVIWASVVLIALAIPDYMFQRSELMESLKMSKQEVKEELKETMGDPYLRARLRDMQREIAMRNMIREVPKADVVVTNPTHYAVALRYDRAIMDAPTVLAKGVDSMALRIREIAKENEVPMIENRPLAQEMYRRLEVGDIVPEDLFYAVSLVYKELHQKKKWNYRAG